MTAESSMADDPGARLRSLTRRLRREKLALERLNPLEHPERYTEAFARVIDLEASRRELREVIGTSEEDGEDADGEPAGA